MSDNVFSRNKFHILDGAMGTMLQKAGLKLGQIPETLSITHKQTILDVHKAYLNVGSDVIYANTFGANALKLKNSGYSVEEIVSASISIAKEAVSGTNAKVALDIGPLGELLEPNGSLSFDSAYEFFKQIILAGSEADLVVFETFSDPYELKAGILATKENSSLPIMCSMSFEANGRTFTGCPVESFASIAVGLGANAVGINCGLGPKEILPLAKRLCAVTPENFPVFVKPNAGLPHADGSGYDLDAESFGEIIDLYGDIGVNMLGGCCGTNPDFIKQISNRYKNKIPCNKPCSISSFVCSATKYERISSVTVVGERINPTGKKRFQQALRENDLDYVLNQAIEQVNAGAQILDVNVGIPDIDETKTLTEVMKAIQSVIDLPLQLDSSSPQALEKALRYYNGIAIVNSVNGEETSLQNILPICKKYGAFVIGLALDKNGIPSSPEGRVEIAKKIVERATSLGIPKNKIFIDCLTMTISSDQNNAKITLEALKQVKERLGVKTALGVSNVSFGLPVRNNVNVSFLTLAMNNGLDLAIINPNAEEMMASVFAYRAISGTDENCLGYVQRYKNAVMQNSVSVVSAVNVKTDASQNAETSLIDCVILGLKNKAKEATQKLLLTTAPLDIVNNHLIVALDKVGADYESGKAYLPELLQSAGSAQSAFEVLKDYFAKNDVKQENKGKIVLATVKGDVHDIGKNIVKVVLENYGYQIIDLGRDVEIQVVCDAVKNNSAKLVGLSALMTTTVKSMAQTINELKKQCPTCKIMVGGAVLTPEYAIKIGADFYSKDAKQSADIAKAFFGK